MAKTKTGVWINITPENTAAYEKYEALKDRFVLQPVQKVKTFLSRPFTTKTHT